MVLTSEAQPLPHDSSDLKGQPLGRVAGGQQLVAEVAPGIVVVFLGDDEWEERDGGSMLPCTFTSAACTPTPSAPLNGPLDSPLPDTHRNHLGHSELQAGGPGTQAAQPRALILFGAEEILFSLGASVSLLVRCQAPVSLDSPLLSFSC